ncbi:hypothetical protein D3C76_1586120 [compost metagenome]
MRQQQAPTEKNIADLRMVISRLGTGFYRSELQTWLKQLQEDNERVALKRVIMNLDSPKLKAELLAVIEQKIPDTGDSNA